MTGCSKFFSAWWEICLCVVSVTPYHLGSFQIIVRCGRLWSFKVDSLFFPLPSLGTHVKISIMLILCICTLQRWRVRHVYYYTMLILWLNCISVTNNFFSQEFMLFWFRYWPYQCIIYKASDCGVKMGTILGRVWTEAGIASFKLLFWHLPGRSE